MMLDRLRTAAVLCCLFLAVAAAATARAMLAPDQVAPDIKGQSVIGGKLEAFDLQVAVKKKAVVLYFFPAAFTPG